MSLIARHLEANGLSTLCMSSALDIVQAGNPPRATFLDYPLGHTAGKPFDPDNQYAVLRDSLAAFERLSQPGAIEHLPNLWSADDAWRDEALDNSGGDLRQPRDVTPRFQTDEDRQLAIASGTFIE